MEKFIIFSTVLCFLFKLGNSLWCYECVSTQPGCGTPFNWWMMWTNVCPEDDDVCVKIIERKGAQEVITRSCLSTQQAQRSDIPADKYEGCRKAAVDLKLSNYVNNSVKELDIYRNYYDETIWCFCFLDHRCNNSFVHLPSVFVLILSTTFVLLQR
ncbi:uncharacterized protein LOC108741014 [Agrilus planipennis]|uniref:Uncharacterized protein LOC108741014 n=1 Tax=Agrilus planipennis TaxID=224129 RepID=A0A1W4X4S8_AGRPL|nr:uncharacterized protein LOC108741014 [Agrilus planipennis]